MLQELKDKISMEEIEEAVFKVVVGPEKKSRLWLIRKRKLKAYHEAGHYSKYVSTTDRVDRISIIPSGMAGFTAYKPDEDKNYDTKSHLMENIIVALGGRAAEQLVLGEISTGAYQDLKKANGIARSMITKYGMSENLGNLVFGNESDEVFIGRDFAQARNYSEEIAAQIDREVKHIIDSCYDRIMKILKENINKLHAVANTLIEKEKIDGHEFEELISSTT